MSPLPHSDAVKYLQIIKLPTVSDPDSDDAHILHLIDAIRGGYHETAILSGGQVGQITAPFNRLTIEDRLALVIRLVSFLSDKKMRDDIVQHLRRDIDVQGIARMKVAEPASRLSGKFPGPKFLKKFKENFISKAAFSALLDYSIEQGYCGQKLQEALVAQDKFSKEAAEFETVIGQHESRLSSARSNEAKEQYTSMLMALKKSQELHAQSPAIRNNIVLLKQLMQKINDHIETFNRLRPDQERSLESTHSELWEGLLPENFAQYLGLSLEEASRKLERGKRLEEAVSAKQEELKTLDTELRDLQKPVVSERAEFPVEPVVNLEISEEMLTPDEIQQLRLESFDTDTATLNTLLKKSTSPDEKEKLLLGQFMNAQGANVKMAQARIKKLLTLINDRISEINRLRGNEPELASENRETFLHILQEAIPSDMAYYLETSLSEVRQKFETLKGLPEAARVEIKTLSDRLSEVDDILAPLAKEELRKKAELEAETEEQLTKNTFRLLQRSFNNFQKMGIPVDFSVPKVITPSTLKEFGENISVLSGRLQEEQSSKDAIMARGSQHLRHYDFLNVWSNLFREQDIATLGSLNVEEIRLAAQNPAISLAAFQEKYDALAGQALLLESHLKSVPAEKIPVEVQKTLSLLKPKDESVAPSSRVSTPDHSELKKLYQDHLTQCRYIDQWLKAFQKVKLCKNIGVLNEKGLSGSVEQQVEFLREHYLRVEKALESVPKDNIPRKLQHKIVEALEKGESPTRNMRFWSAQELEPKPQSFVSRVVTGIFRGFLAKLPLWLASMAVSAFASRGLKQPTPGQEKPERHDMKIND